MACSLAVLWFESGDQRPRMAQDIDQSTEKNQRFLILSLTRDRFSSGVSYAIDVEQGMAYIRGRVDPNKLLKKLSKGGKHADICWVETGNMNPYMNNGYQYPPPGAGYPQPGPGYHPGYHPGYAMASYYPKRPPPYSGYGYGYDPRGYEFPTWA
uniref:HMA domain-containing protein n=1 Tax=Salix viminalis TaxID=40686 RepID=A0A6N2K4H4_SALVM